MYLCRIADWLVGESGRTIRKPLCHELVKLLDALVAGECPRRALQTNASKYLLLITILQSHHAHAQAQQQQVAAHMVMDIVYNVCEAVFLSPFELDGCQGSL